MENESGPTVYDLPPIREMDVAELIPDPDNPRILSDEAADGLRTSISTFGYVEPIIWNKRTGRVVGGHQRLKIMRALGVEKTKVVVWDGDESSERALNVALNNPAIMGDWDTDKLLTRLEQLRTEISDDHLVALRLDELRKLIPDDGPGGNPKEPSEDIDMSPKPTTMPGDLWVLGNHRILCGDARNEQDVRRLTEGKCIDLLLTDPPYNVDYVGKTAKGLKLTNDMMADVEYRKFLSLSLSGLLCDVYVQGPSSTFGTRTRMDTVCARSAQSLR